MKKKLLMITPENKEIHRFRKRQFNNFVQITMPYLAAFVDPEQYEVILVDEYNQKIPFDERFDLIAITVNTSNAAHCYYMSAKFREKGAKVVFGGPHVTLLPVRRKRRGRSFSWISMKEDAGKSCIRWVKCHQWMEYRFQDGI